MGLNGAPPATPAPLRPRKDPHRPRASSFLPPLRCNRCNRCKRDTGSSFAEYNATQERGSLLPFHRFVLLQPFHSPVACPVPRVPLFCAAFRSVSFRFPSCSTPGLSAPQGRVNAATGFYGARATRQRFLLSTRTAHKGAPAAVYVCFPVPLASRGS